MAGDEILTKCVELGGSVTGELVSVPRELISGKQFAKDDLEAMKMLRSFLIRANAAIRTKCSPEPSVRVAQRTDLGMSAAIEHRKPSGRISHLQ